MRCCVVLGVSGVGRVGVETCRGLHGCEHDAAAAAIYVHQALSRDGGADEGAAGALDGEVER